MTSVSKGAIFREQALERYLQGREQHILPRFVAPPVFLFFWCLLALFLGAGLLAWAEQVPIYVAGIGIILDSGTSSTGNEGAVAIIFVPARSAPHLRVGQPISVQLNSSQYQSISTIRVIEPRILSPSEIRQRYSLAVLEPSRAMTIILKGNISGQLYAGSPLQAQLQVGSRRLLSLFPGIDTVVKVI